MTTKITLTIKRNDEIGSSQAMADTIALLTSLGISMPSKKLTLVVECETEDLDTYRDELRVVLASRPVGIEVELKTESKESVERGRMVRVTPMDQAWAN